MFAARRIRDAAAGLRSLPDRRDWLRAGVELGWAVPLMLILTHLGGLMRWTGPPDPSTFLTVAAILFVAPALGEELLFRGLLIPREPPAARWIIASALMFVLWHPLQLVTIGPPWAAVFLNPWFLASTLVLGIALGRIYVRTASLWPCIVAHWLVVACWKLLLGGPF